MSLINQGVKQGLIKFDDEQKYITYLNQNKQRNYNNPEEKVQAETFLKLILIYGYSPEKILQFVPVTIGSTTKEADIIVYNDNNHHSAHIVVECKKQEVSELEFKQAISQAFSYAATGTVRAKYFWVTSGIKDEYYEIPEKEPKKYLSIPDIPQFGVTKLAKYKYAKGGGEINKQRLFELQTVTEDDLTRRFKQAHNALWGGGELNPSTAFDELDKLIFCKIWDEKKPRKLGEPYDFQIFKEDNEEKSNEELIKRIKSLYDEGRKKDPEVFKDDIRLSPEKLRTVVGYLEGINLGATDLDSKGRAFETFMGSFFRGDFGQFFTPRNIVKFIVDVLPINHNSLVLDTSCGSGGFLLHALDKIRQQAKEYYPENSIEHYKYWHDFAEKNLFGIEINEQIARTAKMNMIIHDDGHTNVISADGLLPSEEIINKTNNQGFSYNRFDFIITNPPFGSIVKQTEQAYMQNYGFAMKEVDWLNPKSKQSGRENQNTEILFIEQCYNFLREGGYLAIVIPDGILTNSSLQYVRDWIEEKFRIVGVVSLPQTAFQATGAGVKSSILFLKKHDLTTTEKIQQQILGLQDALKNNYKYLDLLKSLEKEKKEKIKNLDGFNNVEGLAGKALKDSESFKEWNQEVNNEYRERIDEIKANLLDDYLTEKQRLLHDYSIFMAIAEDIGYDATGKATNNNELDVIGEELKRFIDAVEKENDSFFLSEDVDKNKIFLVKVSNLEKRLDSEYYHPNNYQDLYLLKNSPYQLFLLEKICNRVVDGPFGSSIKAQDYVNQGIPFIRVADVTHGEGSIKLDNLIFISLEAHERIIRSKVIPGDIVIAKTGATMGAASIIPTNILEANIRGDLAALTVKNSYCTSEYLTIYINTNIGQRLFWRLDSGGTRGRVVIGNLKKYPVIIPPLEIQNKIVAKMDNAYTSKKQKEAEAQRLLDSIDDYLLGELGIELPQLSENTVSDRIFYRKLSDISGNRFDPYSNKTEFVQLLEQIQKVKFEKRKLKNISKTIINGYDYRQYCDSGLMYLRVGNIKKYEFDLLDIKYIPEFEITKNIALQEGNLLITRKGSYGISVIVDKTITNAVISSEIFKIEFNTEAKLNPYYICAWLNSKAGQLYFDKIKTGAIMGHISQEVLGNIPIILPPFEKQNEIAEHITKIREKAKQLQQEAKIELEQAKMDVEKMILGE